MPGGQKPLELILARNLLTSLSTPAFLVSSEAQLLFYNEAAGALLGAPFEETGRMEPERWVATFGPFDGDGNPVSIDDLRLTGALRDGRPAHADFCVRSTAGETHQIAASAMPITSAESGNSGAMIFFWPLDEDVARKLSLGKYGSGQ